jgi:hypothetical protein
MVATARTARRLMVDARDGVTQKKAPVGRGLGHHLLDSVCPKKEGCRSAISPASPCGRC